MFASWVGNRKDTIHALWGLLLSLFFFSPASSFMKNELMLCVFFCCPALCDAILEGFPFSVDINALFVCFQAFNDIQLGGAALLLNTCLGNCSMIRSHNSCFPFIVTFICLTLQPIYVWILQSSDWQNVAMP